jgi:predicted phosphodiesterase
MRITLLSDTHNKHKQISPEYFNSDLVLHAGDISSMGYKHEIEDFCEWYDSIHSSINVFIAGNHDWGFQRNPEEVRTILSSYKNIEYLQDSEITVTVGDSPEVKIYGSPWQPEFYNWAFNLPRNGEELKNKWGSIPQDTDILITHGPPFGVLDDVEGRRGVHLGCELLIERIKAIKPKICVFGHIHSGYGHYYDGHTHYFNASVLNERYIHTQEPWVIDWDPVTNEIKFI